MVGAGVIFKEVQTWELFVNISEIVILVPALLGLKGNLEMTLAARLSTQVRINHTQYPNPKIVFDTQKLCVLSMGIGYGYHTNTHI